MKYLITVAQAYGFLFIIYALYLAVMSAVRIHKDPTKIISTPAKFFLYPMLLLFIVLDWSLNIMMSIPYLEVPTRLFELYTDRLTRHHDKDDYRGKFSRWFAHSFLDDYDPSGNHVPGEGHE